MTVRRRFLLVAVLVLVAAAVALLLRPAPLHVEAASVTRGPLETAVEAEGQTRIHPRHVVAAPVDGHLATIELDPGDAVAAGQVVARLAPSPLDARSRQRAEAAVEAARAAVRRSEAEVESAEALHVLAAVTSERSRELAAAGQVAAEELDRALTGERTAGEALEAARAAVMAARFELASARAALLDAAAGVEVVVRVPVAGVVLRQFERSERVVPAGTPLLEIGDLGDLEVVAEVLSTDAVAIPPAARLAADFGDGRWWPGRVERIEPTGFTKVSPLGVEEQRVAVIGRLDERPSAAGDRFRVRVRLVLWRGEEVLQVPAGATFRAGDEWATWVVEAGRARRRDLRLGHRGDEAMEVLAGLAAGDLVVLYPPRQLTEGRRVRVAGD